MQQLLQSYQRRLSNISGSNRSLLLLKLINAQTIDLHAFDFLNKGPSFDIIEKIIAGKNKIKLSSVLDSRDAESNVMTTRLKRLRRRAQFISEETGAFDLYVGWPFVHGQFADGTLVRCPLMFFPVQLEENGNNWELSIRDEVNITLNKTFLLAYAHYNQISLADELLEMSFDDFDSDSRAFRTALYELLRDSAIELNFNQDLFKDQLIAFKDFKKADFDQCQNTGELKLFSEGVLGIFPQADSYLVPDYDFLLGQRQFSSLEDFFHSKTMESEDRLDAHSDDYSYFLSKVKEEQTFTPFQLDAYQENAIKAVKRGNSMVIQGPPGTGKSQLICNLISDYIARGKKVLVVCQKRAALDVVYGRLEQHKLNGFVGRVHDFKNDRKEIYEKIESQIERLNEYQRSNNNLDSIQLERDFQQSSRAIDQITEELEEYRKVLFDESECGVSIKELYLTSDPDQESISLTQEYHGLPVRDIAAFEKELRHYLAHAHELNHKEHPWAERVNFAGFGLSDLKTIQTSLKEIPDYVQHVVNRVSSAVEEEVDYDSCRTYSENLDKLSEMIHLLESDEVYGFFRDMATFSNDVTESLWLENTRKLINHCFDEFGVESAIPAQEIGEIQTILKKRSSAKKSFIESIKWSFSKEKTRLARILVANGLRDDQSGLDELTKRLDNRLNLQHQMTKLRSAEWIKKFPENLEQSEINFWFDKVDTALQAKILFASFTNFKEYFNLQKLNSQEFKQRVGSVITALTELPIKRQIWNKYILPRQIDMLLSSDQFYVALQERIRKDFDSICELDKLKSEFSESGIGVINKLEELEAYSIDRVVEVFLNSLRLAWIDHIERKYEILRAVSTLKFDRMIEDLQSAVVKKMEVSNEILLQRARENTYETVEYNRLNNRVTYRDLHHQVTKKRSVWPIRKLINNFSEELFQLMPCWMASPESVSAIFPMEMFFDLVVFDEASQCFSEKGLPAMYRGKQLVIAGDMMQLQPNDIYQTRWNEDADGIEYEVDSLLDLGRKYLMETALRGHYRSQSLDLIQFSNEKFYGGKLSLLPHFDRINDASPGIIYHKVPGKWVRQSNLVEAESVVSFVRDLREENPSKSIGIVTFNIVQQGLIQDMLEEEGVLISQSLFVKNIENVQGDECDIVIFSVGYGPDENGRINAQFGSLNVVGGENRLNVAVTRAREKVIVVTSIWPEQLKVEEAKNDGPKLLKEYLSYAKSVSDDGLKLERTSMVSKKQDWYLSQQLIQWESNYSVEFKQELPFSDLTVKNGPDYQALILTDDDLYYASPSEKEAFVYKPSVLESKGWKYRFFHSRNFWADKEKVRENMNRFLENASNTD